MYDDEIRSRRHYERRARWYDRANWLAATLRGTSGHRERLKAIAKLRLRPHDRVLEVSSGTGTNLMLMQRNTGGGAIVGLDISRSMLMRCTRKLRRSGASAELVEGEAAHLPFASGAFDAVLHHGGFAEFGDSRGALAEMARVARPGARIVICDVGVPADRSLPLVSKLLLFTQPVYRKPPPVERLPPDAQDVQLTWIGGGAWYLIDFTNGEARER
jgi:ubiquinone/menaquinone biosynthesis C-methylase UbiE